MTYRYLISAGALAVVLASVSPVVVPVVGQAPRAAATYTPPSSTYTPPRTPWGDPDLQGVFDYQSLVTMERVAELAGKTMFTEAEYAEWIKVHHRNFDSCGFGTRKNEKCTEAQLKAVNGYNEFWDNRNYPKDLRTSLIVDPADGRIPPMLPEAKARQIAILGREPGPPRPIGPIGSEDGGGGGGDSKPINSWEDLPATVRCIAGMTPNGVQEYNTGTYIMQSPGWVLIVRERWDIRPIPLDGRPHISQNIRQWNGNSVGRWEGNTLVVDTTNFTDKQRMGGPSSTVPAGVPMGNIHLIERFVPVSTNLIHYYATIEDPKTWVRPWTFMLPWQRDPAYQQYEFACNEGNVSVGAGLKGDRMKEAEAAKAGNN